MILDLVGQLPGYITMNFVPGTGAGPVAFALFQDAAHAQEALNALQGRTICETPVIAQVAAARTPLPTPPPEPHTHTPRHHTQHRHARARAGARRHRPTSATALVATISRTHVPIFLPRPRTDCKEVPGAEAGGRRRRRGRRQRRRWRRQWRRRR